MANLKPEEYFRLQFPNNPDWKLIKAVVIDSPNLTMSKNMPIILWIIKQDKKTGTYAFLYPEYDTDGTTYKKNKSGKYFSIYRGRYSSEFSKSKSEMEQFTSNSTLQTEFINSIFEKDKQNGITNGPWSITQDPWDPNVVPESLRKDMPEIAAPTQSVAPTPAQTNAATPGPTHSEKLNADFTFNVEKEGIFVCADPNIGELTLIKKESEKSTTVDPVVSPENEEYLDPEYTENEFSAEEEQETIFVTSKYESEPMSGDSYEETTVVDLATGDAADFWSLMAICACEDGDPQGRADVAQSIYNRVLAGIYGGKSIKKVVCNNGQYEPAFNKSNRSVTSDSWKAIADRKTAIAAVSYAKGIDERKALYALRATYGALSDPKRQAAAREWVGPRCDFLGAGLGKKWFKKTTGEWQLFASSTDPRRRNDDDNIFGNVVGPGAWKWGLDGKIAGVPNFFAKYREEMFAEAV